MGGFYFLENIFQMNSHATVATSEWVRNSDKTGESSWGTSDNGATTAPWQLCKVYTHDPIFERNLSRAGLVEHTQPAIPGILLGYYLYPILW